MQIAFGQVRRKTLPAKECVSPEKSSHKGNVEYFTFLPKCILQMLVYQKSSFM